MRKCMCRQNSCLKIEFFDLVKKCDAPTLRAVPQPEFVYLTHITTLIVMFVLAFL